jgi:hypothetical protein
MGKRNTESGSVIFFILLGVVLIGLVTAAIQAGGGKGSNIDREQLILKIKQVREQSQEFERAVAFILRNGVSESDIRFAYTSAPVQYGNIDDNPGTPAQYTFQVFHRLGGGSEYRPPPNGLTNTAVDWEFYGHTHFPGVGEDPTGNEQAELIAVIPDVTDEFCNEINRINGFDTSTQPEDGGASQVDCIHGGSTVRFGPGAQFQATPNTVDTGTFSGVTGAMEGCLQCATDTKKHYFHILLAR